MGQIITQTNLESLIGDLGVDNLTDDGTEATLVATVIEQAESWIFSKLAFKYSASVLAQSPLIVHAATYIAAYYLTERRGNPFHYKDQVDDLKQDIEDLRVGKAELTDVNGVQLNQDNLEDYPISMQNLVIDERHAYNRIRTVGQTSVQTENENLFRQDGFRGLFGSA
jgi:hypothetical protein